MNKSDFVQDIVNRANASRKMAIDKLPASVSQYIDRQTSIPEPFIEGNMEDVRLIIIGQDPTTKNRKKPVTTVLNLNNKGSSLFKFVQRITVGLGFNLGKEVYATNLCKWFFTQTPTDIKANYGVDNILKSTKSYWLLDLLYEISCFNKNAIVVTLGEPVLNLVVKSPTPRHQIKEYWGYTEKLNNNPSFDPKPSFNLLQRQDNIFGRIVLPFPHINSVKFFGKYIDDYLAWAKNKI